MADESLILLGKEVRGKTLRLLEGVSDTDARWVPPGLDNSIVWHAGHSLQPDKLTVLIAGDRSRRRFPVARRVSDRPACKRFGHFNDVLLGVSAIDTERVKLHKLARIILVNPVLLFLLVALWIVSKLLQPLIDLRVGDAALS